MKKVLIVDDSAAVRETCRQILERHGLEVAVAVGFSHAIKKIGEFRPDLLLLDINLASDDGITLGHRVRKTFGDIKIIFVSGLGDEETIIRAREIKPVGYILKPISEETLVKRVMTAFYPLPEKPGEGARDASGLVRVSGLPEPGGRLVTVCSDSFDDTVRAELAKAVDECAGERAQQLLFDFSQVTAMTTEQLFFLSSFASDLETRRVFTAFVIRDRDIIETLREMDLTAYVAVFPDVGPARDHLRKRMGGGWK